MMSAEMPLPWEDRETQKYAGWELVSSTNPMQERQRGLLMVIHAHFERSREAWAIRPGHHPDHPGLVEYTRHWLYANRPLPLGGEGEQVAGSLRRHYRPPTKPMMGHGSSYWGSA